jgi:hypothetical protein
VESLSIISQLHGEGKSISWLIMNGMHPVLTSSSSPIVCEEVQEVKDRNTVHEGALGAILFHFQEAPTRAPILFLSYVPLQPINLEKAVKDMENLVYTVYLLSALTG